jgi:hypothetical protein
MRPAFALVRRSAQREGGRPTMADKRFGGQA